MTTIAAIMKPNSIIITRRTPTQLHRQQQKNNRIIKVATSMIVNKVGTIIIGTKIVSINQTLITIHTNPVVRIKRTLFQTLALTFSPHGALVFRTLLQ